MEEIHFKKTMSFSYGQPDPICPGIIRLVAKNPGPFTFKGTNTYVIGTSALAIIDPGPADETHMNALLSLAGDRKISHVLITHAHRDHSDGARQLCKKTGAAIAAYGRSRIEQRVNPADRIRSASLIDYDFTPDITLRNGDTLKSEDWELKAIHTPGHAPDHLCFSLEQGRALFTGDHVMAWNTTVVAPPEGRMSDYISSLELLLDRRDRLYLPGHGGRLENPLRSVKAYLVHRQWREQAILAEIRRGSKCVSDILAKVYPNVVKEIQTAASFSILAHVEYLAERNLITYQPPLSLETNFFAA